MKLKFLTSISSEQIDYKTLLQEILGVKKLRWYDSIRFIRVFKKLSLEIESLRQLKVKEIEESKDCKVKRPDSIDLIAYGAMTELQVLFENPGEREIAELISETIALSCYESHTKNSFDSDSREFKKFLEYVSNSDLVEMLGLYNWIDAELKASKDKWDRHFTSVLVHDKDWDNAGGKMMEKFHILSTIKTTCAAFNLNYYEVLKFPYALVMTNLLSDSTKGFIQDRMRAIIESRMRTENKNLK